MVALFADDHPRARDLFGQALARFDALGEATPATLLGQSTLALIIAGQGDPGRAEAMAQQTLAICEQRGDRWTTGWVFYVLALTAFAHGDLAAAVTRARDGLRRMLVFHKWPTTSAGCPPDRYRRGGPAGTRWSPVDTESDRTARRPRGSASALWRLTMVGGAVRALPLPPTTGRRLSRQRTRVTVQQTAAGC